MVRSVYTWWGDTVAISPVPLHTSRQYPAAALRQNVYGAQGLPPYPHPPSTFSVDDRWRWRCNRL